MFDNFNEIDMLCNLLHKSYKIHTILIKDLLYINYTQNTFLILYVNTELSDKQNGINNLKNIQIPFYLTSISNSYDYLIKIKDIPNFKGIIATSKELANICDNLNIPNICIFRKKYINYNILNYIYQPIRIACVIKNLKFHSTYFSKTNTIYEDNTYNNIMKIKENIPIVKLIGEDSFENRDDILSTLKFLIHIKYWGHVCNIVIECISHGIPIIMDKKTYEIGFFSNYLIHNYNGLIFDDIDDIICFLNNENLDNIWNTLRQNSLDFSKNFALPYTETEILEINNFIDNTFS